MIRIKWIAVLLVLLAMGCAKEESAVVENLDFDTLTAEFDTFTAGFADANTKTYVDENLRLFWHEKDEISIFTSTLNTPYQFKGKTGDNSGTFKNISTEFGTGATSLPLNYAVYPYLENTAISYDGEITLELPAVQCYVENSFGRGANSMVAVTSTKQDLFLPFKNLCGYLKLKIYGENVGIKSIELKGNSNEILSGFSKVIAKYGTDPNLTTSKDGGKTITLKTPDGGVELGTSSENATEFWFVIPPITFTNGITVTVVDVWGNKTTKSTSNEIVIERNIVKAMEPFKVEFEGGTYESRILYTTSDNKAISVDEVNFNAAIVSNIYDEEKGEGTITFKGQLTEIKEGAFRVKTTLTSISIPEGVLTIGNSAFQECSNLKVVTSHCEDAPNIEYDTFSGVTARLMVPKGGVASYKATLWGQSFSNILEISDLSAYTDLSASGTANCYLVKAGGDYRFKAVKGNGSISVGEVTGVEVLWESFGTDAAIYDGDIVSHAGFMDGYICFSTNSIFKDGNAVIAAKDTDGKILWSWHIWCSDEGWTDHVYANNAGTMMDRNLGATSATPGDVGALGLLYQWGRKDPFLGSNASKGAEPAASTGNWGTVTGQQSVDYTVENPMMFIYGSSEWCSSYTDDQRWMDSQKTMYDPCPVGYRVPKGGENGFWGSALKEEILFTLWDFTYNGFYIKLPNKLEAWYPAAGYYTLYTKGVELFRVGSAGYWWSATYDLNSKDTARSLYVFYYGDIRPGANCSREQGNSVRCVRE